MCLSFLSGDQNVQETVGYVSNNLPYYIVSLNMRLILNIILGLLWLLGAISIKFFIFLLFKFVIVRPIHGNIICRTLAIVIHGFIISWIVL